MDSKNNSSDFTTEAILDPKTPLTASTAGASERMLALYEIGRQLLEQREPGKVLRTIHKAIVEHLKPDHACILILEADGSYQPVVTHNLELEGPEAEWALSRTALEKVKKDSLAVLTTDASKDKLFEGASSVFKFRIRSVMCVPLGKVPIRGLIYADRRAKVKFFGREDLEFLTAISVYAALILERSEEYVRTSEALKRSDERLELLQDELLRHQIVGQSPLLLSAFDSLRRFARAGAKVLLRGETGTGKDLFARAYAANSGRSRGPYMPVPIPALAPTLVESELFGHVRGAFTEASRDKKGRLELADKGVLFLDEIGDVEPALQPKLLRFLDSGELFRVGDTTPRRVDTLVVSATNRPLEKLIKEGRFRDDLLARLGQLVTVPPLRERRDDIPRLVDYFLSMYDRSPKKKIFDDRTMEILQNYDWEFNVRQLQQVVERVICLVDGQVIQPKDLPDFILKGSRTELPPSTPSPAAGSGTRPRPLKEVTDELEKAHILRTLEYTKGNKRKAIEILQLSSDTFYKRLDKFGLLKK